MRGTKAKRLRREARDRGDLPEPKQFFEPFTLPLPTGKTDPETGEQETVERYIPRRERRKFMRQFMTDLRKGRVPLPGAKE
jgi:hypothetical protein